MKPQAHAAVKECALRAHPWANTTRRFSPDPFSFGKKDANPSTTFCRAAACSCVTRKFVPRAHRRILRPANSGRDNKYFREITGSSRLTFGALREADRPRTSRSLE